MSAIFGMLRFDGAASDSARELERMGNTLGHRGPDGRKSIRRRPGRLRSLPDAGEPRGPIRGAAALRPRKPTSTLVADLPARQSRRAGCGVRPRSRPTCETCPTVRCVLRAYKKWGEDCAAHLLGDFAFAIWDGRAKKLLLGRDHMGQRYVHYHHGKGFFAFATEIKALWALADVPRKLCDIKSASISSSTRVQRRCNILRGHLRAFRAARQWRSTRMARTPYADIGNLGPAPSTSIAMRPTTLKSIAAFLPRPSNAAFAG